MDRRSLIAKGASIPLVGLAGCQSVQMTSPSSGDGNESDQDPEDGSATTVRERAHQAGETVTHDQIEVAANQLLAAGEYRLDVEDSEVRPPTAGGYWMFVNLSVTHVGDERRPFPHAEDTQMPYETEATARQFFEDEDFEVRENVYTNYHATLARKAIYDRGAFPGVTVGGWLVFEVPRQYQLGKLLVELQWGTESAGQTTERWKFSEDDIIRTPQRDYSG
jgi:hypothetical protein